MKVNELKASLSVVAGIGAQVWSEEGKQRFIDWIVKWRGLLFMNGYHFNVVFSERPDDDSPTTCSASITVNDSYMSGHAITIYPRMLQELDLEEQERKIVHELVHVMTYPLKDVVWKILSEKLVTWREAKEADEHLVDWIASVIYSIHGLNAGDGIGSEGVLACSANESSNPT